HREHIVVGEVAVDQLPRTARMADRGERIVEAGELIDGERRRLLRRHLDRGRRVVEPREVGADVEHRRRLGPPGDLAPEEGHRASPADGGAVQLIVRRPAVEERELLEVAELRIDEGIVGDTWRDRGSRHTPDGSAEPGRQITIMNARAIALFAGDDRSRWAEA